MVYEIIDTIAFAQHGCNQGWREAYRRQLLTYLRKVVPEDTVGEFRAESYEVFLKEFCISVDI